MSNIDFGFRIDTLSLNDNVLITERNIDPSINPGYEAPIGSLLINPDTGLLYRKYDVNDINWVMLGDSTDIVVADAIDGQNGSFKSNDDYIWNDLKDPFVVRAVQGGNNPTWDTFFNNIQGLKFSGTTMNQVWCDFHIEHDIAKNTKIYPHVHWMPTSNNSGTVRWGFEYTIAKSHGQQQFPSTTTVYSTTTINSNSIWLNSIGEVSDNDAILSNDIEPDSIIKMRIFRDATNDTYPDYVAAWQADIHYQVARLGTRNRMPNFYGE